MFEVSESGEVTGITENGLRHFNQFVDEFPKASLLPLADGPHRLMLEASNREAALIELAKVKASMIEANNPNVLVMAMKEYPFSAEAVQQLLEFPASIERFRISQEPL